jgi:hypothetical protein
MAAEQMTAKKAAILGNDSAEASVLRRLIEKAAYRTEIYSSLLSLKEGLSLNGFIPNCRNPSVLFCMPV